MGTKMAPAYATLTLAYLEENLYEIIGKKYGNDIKEEFTKSWKRNWDDCFNKYLNAFYLKKFACMWNFHKIYLEHICIYYI